MIKKQANTEFKKMNKSLAISILTGITMGGVIAVLLRTFGVA